MSVPIGREEVQQIKGAAQWTLRNVVQRLDELGEDPWAGYGKTRQTITAKMRRQLGME